MGEGGGAGERRVCMEKQHKNEPPKRKRATVARGLTAYRQRMCISLFTQLWVVECSINIIPHAQSPPFVCGWAGG